LAATTNPINAQKETVKNLIIGGLSVPNTTPLGKLNNDSDCGARRIRFSSGVPRLRTFFKYWLPVLAWMALIFSASSDKHSYEHSSRLVEPLLRWLFPHMSEAHIHAVHELLRKCAHLTEYAVLALLVWRGVRKPSKNNPRPWNWPEARFTLLMVMLYAATDEFHQRFVPTRTSLVSDVFIDTAGGAAGLLALWMIGRWRKLR
jgi:VanZ family protein